jgi:hypothetical protein
VTFCGLPLAGATHFSEPCIDGCPERELVRRDRGEESAACRVALFLFDALGFGADSEID